VKFTPLPIPGAFLVEAKWAEDDRGRFTTFFDAEAFREQGLCVEWALFSSASNRRRGILRGLHHQAAPHEETKFVSCARGAIFDVIVDLREDSPEYLRWTSVELRAGTGVSLYIPKGCAHGYQVLEDGSEVKYLISAPYHPELQRGLRWDDPLLAIRWPLPEIVQLSARDKALPFVDAMRKSR